MSSRWRVGWILLGLVLVGSRCNRPTAVKPPQVSACQEGEVINVSCDSMYSASPAMVSHEDNLYIVWGSTTGPYDYASLRCVFRALEGGQWTKIDTVSTGPTWGCFLAVDRWGRVHVVWEEDDLERNESAAMYRMRDEHGVWGLPQRLSPWSNPEKQVRIGVDPTGRVHVIWGGHYKSRSSEGAWDVEEEGVPVGLNPFMVVDSAGGVHVVWGSERVVYAYRSPEGAWWDTTLAEGWGIWFGWVSLVRDTVVISWTRQDDAVEPNSGSIWVSLKTPAGWEGPFWLEGSRVGHAWPRDKFFYHDEARWWVLWGDGYWEIYLGWSRDLRKGLEGVRKVWEGGSPYPRVVWGREVVWVAAMMRDTVEGDYDVFLREISLAP